MSGSPSLPGLAITPHGRLVLAAHDTDLTVEDAFSQSSAHGLLHLAARRDDGEWPATTAFWRAFANQFLTALAHAPDDAADDAPMPPALGFELTLRIPPMRGAEYASPDLFATLGSEMRAAAAQNARTAGGLQRWLGTEPPRFRRRLNFLTQATMA